MKKLFLFILLAISINSFAQNKHNQEEKEILLKVQQFFDALETQDTILFKSILLPEGQMWSISEKENSVKYSMSQFRDRLKTFINPARVIQEKMLSSEIKIHKQIAMAWVPYTLNISSKFSHTGVDVFTLLKTNEGWKISTIAFTMDYGSSPE
ncbi:Putative lumazine-binding [Daejeonella rubra]|uniref:Putative lumazine-binding n=1 Tax=Daejeonella rubra TaxID=990371 RepID=A0A1G9MQ76_9SPHI|nr:nuclear transport factor 2 family protein [Daejeonella rubra]SDL76171.1 Putative lumazine-binding [Daejeonella rubra]